MDTRPIKALSVTYEDDSVEVFGGDFGYVTDDKTIVKTSDGREAQTVTRVVASLTTHHGDWKRC